MGTRIAALTIAALGVTSVHAADVTPAPACAAPAATVSREFRLAKPGGRMPVRGIGHLVAVYGTAAAAQADPAPHAAERAANAVPSANASSS